jgi:hypothetical protein
MDARAVAQISGIEVGTLNVWVQRGIIPGMSVGARGRQRDFDLKTATHILIVSELVRLGLGAPAASEWATRTQFSEWLIVTNRDAREPVPGGPADLLMIPRPAGFLIVEARTEADVLNALNARHDGSDHQHGDVYIVIHAKELRERMREAFQQWEQLRADEE